MFQKKPTHCVHGIYTITHASLKVGRDCSCSWFGTACRRKAHFGVAPSAQWNCVTLSSPMPQVPGTWSWSSAFNNFTWSCVSSGAWQSINAHIFFVSTASGSFFMCKFVAMTGDPPWSPSNKKQSDQRSTLAVDSKSDNKNLTRSWKIAFWVLQEVLDSI